MKRHAFLLLLIAVPGCSGGSPSKTAATGTAAPAEPPTSRHLELKVSADLQRQWGVVAGRPTRAAAAGVIQLQGVLRMDERHTAQITSLLDGKVVALRAELGADVHQGDVLATIQAPTLAQAKTTFLQAGARLEQARREHERSQMLLQREAIDQKEALRRRTDYDNAVSELGVAESQLHSLGYDQPAVDALLARARQAGSQPHPDELADPLLQITSPISGRVVERDVIAGQHIEPQKPLFTVSNLGTLWAVLDARESDLPHLAKGRPARIRTSVYPDRTWDGVITHIGDVVDEKSRTVKVRVDTRNDGLLLKPNMFVLGEITVGPDGREQLTVPEEAIQTFNGNPVVFVRMADDRFAVRPVEIGERAGAGRVVTSGLDGSETLAIAGTFNLKAELLKSSLGGE